MLITIIYMDSNKCRVPASISFFNPISSASGVGGRVFKPSEIHFRHKNFARLRTRSCMDDEMYQRSYIVLNFVLMYVCMVFYICQGHIFCNKIL